MKGARHDPSRMSEESEYHSMLPNVPIEVRISGAWRGDAARRRLLSHEPMQGAV